MGFRCRECGKPASDPLTSFTPVQIATGGGVAVAAGLVSGLAGSLGLLGLCVALFAGGFAAEAVYRRIGYKRGAALTALVFGGLLLGTVVGYAVVYSGLWLPGSMQLEAYGPEAGAFVAQTIGGAVLIGAVACLGARTRLR